MIIHYEKCRPSFLFLITIMILVCSIASVAVAQTLQAIKADPGNNNPPPAGAILDLNGTPIPGGGNGTYQQYGANFTASVANTAITFAFRDDPAFISFANASVTDVTHPNGNLLVNGDFSGGTYTDNGNTLTPDGWTYTNQYGADAGGITESGSSYCYVFSYCWYDGAVQAYDAMSQTIATQVGDTYQITFSLAEDSGCGTNGGPPCNFSDLSTNGDTTDTGGNGIDVTVYAQAGLPQPQGPFAYVANTESNTVSVIQIPTSSVVNTVPVGSGPWGVAVSPDQTQVYVSNNQGNNVSVIDAASSNVVTTIPVQSSPFGVAFTPDGTSVYVVNGSSNSVSVIDTASQTVVATVPVQSSPVGVAMARTSNGTFAYVTNSASNTVSVIAVRSSPTVAKTIPVGSGPRWVAVSPNSSLVYVENAGTNTVSVISVATNTVTASITVGVSPFGAAFTPDSSTAYVVNGASNTVSVIDTASEGVINTMSGLNNPTQVALSADGASAYVTNQNANDVSVIATASNTITGTVPVGAVPIGVAIASNAPSTLQITQPLSPTQPNVFNFGTNNFQVQYPPGTSFSNVSMTVTSVQITQAQFQQRVTGTQFANATCIVYGGTGGNCVDDQVTCTQNGDPITCPSESTPTIAVQTSFSTSQAIVNPGYLTTPIGQNNWTNIFAGYSDPTVKGKTTGFSEFVAVTLGATNPQGAGVMTLLAPLRPTDPRVFVAGAGIPATFQLMSIANPTQPVTDAVGDITIVWVSDASGSPESEVVLARNNAFKYQSGIGYSYQINTSGYQTGKYILTVYGNAFAAQQVQFNIESAATTCAVKSSSNLFSKGHRITFTAFVKPVPPATGTPTGSITFLDATYSLITLETSPLVHGRASLHVVLHAPPNRQYIKAVYSGDSNFGPCESPYITEDYSSPE